MLHPLPYLPGPRMRGPVGRLAAPTLPAAAGVGDSGGHTAAVVAAAAAAESDCGASNKRRLQHQRPAVPPISRLSRRPPPVLQVREGARVLSSRSSSAPGLAEQGQLLTSWRAACIIGRSAVRACPANAPLDACPPPLSTRLQASAYRPRCGCAHPVSRRRCGRRRRRCYDSSRVRGACEERAGMSFDIRCQACNACTPGLFLDQQGWRYCSC